MIMLWSKLNLLTFVVFVKLFVVMVVEMMGQLQTWHLLFSSQLRRARAVTALPQYDILKTLTWELN